VVQKCVHFFGSILFLCCAIWKRERDYCSCVLDCAKKNSRIHGTFCCQTHSHMDVSKIGMCEKCDKNGTNLNEEYCHFSIHTMYYLDSKSINSTDTVFCNTDIIGGSRNNCTAYSFEGHTNTLSIVKYFTRLCFHIHSKSHFITDFPHAN